MKNVNKQLKTDYTVQGTYSMHILCNTKIYNKLWQLVESTNMKLMSQRIDYKKKYIFQPSHT